MWFLVTVPRLRSVFVALLGCLGAMAAASPSIAGAAGERGYEQVSPQDKGADVEIGGTARASGAGGAVAFTSLGNLAPSGSRGFSNEFHGARASDGHWNIKSMNIPIDSYPNLGQGQVYHAVSPDASMGVGLSWGSLEFGHPQAFNLWRSRALDGGLDLLSKPSGVTLQPESISFGTVSSGSNFAGGSEDFSHIVFHSSRRLIQEAPTEFEGQPLAPSTTPHISTSGTMVRYDLSASGPPPKVADLCSGPPWGMATPPSTFNIQASTRCRPMDRASSSLTPAARPVPSVSSTCASPIPLSLVGAGRCRCLSPSGPTAPVTRRAEGTTSRNPAPEPPGQRGASFQLADADADGPALFASSEKLTDDSNAIGSGGVFDGVDHCSFARCDLYRWDPSLPVGERLTDLTADATDGAGVLGVIGGSDSIARVLRRQQRGASRWGRRWPAEPVPVAGRRGHPIHRGARAWRGPIRVAPPAGGRGPDR